MAEQNRVTLPVLVRALGVTRATAERLVHQYRDRVGSPERFGIVRAWPAESLDTLRGALYEENRLKEQRR